MSTETARVVAVEQGELWVETIRRSACASCSAQKGCGHGLMERTMGSRAHRLKVLPGRFSLQSFHEGDEVTIEVSEFALISGALWLYLVPLLSLLLGATAGYAIWAADGAAALGALFGLVSGLWLVRRHTRRCAHDERYQPVVVSNRVQALQLSE